MHPPRPTIIVGIEEVRMKLPPDRIMQGNEVRRSHPRPTYAGYPIAFHGDREGWWPDAPRGRMLSGWRTRSPPSRGDHAS
jgi:hypothetical protein